MTTDLPVPDEAVETLRVCDADRHMHDRAETCVAAISRPVVVAELQALATRVAALRSTQNVTFRDGNPDVLDGFDAAIGAVRELIADRCGELGTRVEGL